MNKPLRREPHKLLEKGISWPRGQAFSRLSIPADTLDGIDVANGNLSSSEKTMFAALQGLVNKTQPRIFLYEVAPEGKNKWPGHLHLNIREYPSTRKWQLLEKYRKEIAGVVLYTTEKNAAYRNLASTVSGIRNALPVTPADYAALTRYGIRLPVLEDLTKLPYTTAAEIYRYLYDHYWKACTQQLLVSLSPGVETRIRDIGIASGAAFVWLDPRKEEEKQVLNTFLADMKAGESIILGWWPEERSGVGLGTSRGISTVAADFYENASVYAGMSHIISLPEVPKMPKLENKIYIAVFLSDGDNVQYCQHAMSKLWDDKSRGIIPINWTVSPALADLGPGLLNYYYATATPNDFFASGPSGLGYALIYDALNKKWNLSGEQRYIDAYTKFTQPYIEKAGLRVITIWDELNGAQMEAYTNNCRYLYGATLEDWGRGAPLKTVTKGGRLAFIPNRPGYAGNVDDIYKKWQQQIKTFDGSKPLFLAAQGISWKMGPKDIVRLKEKLEALSPGNIVICRGDHFFSLFNKAHQLDFNLTLSPEMEISSSPAATDAAYAADGTPSGKYKWVSSGNGAKWIRFDFKQPYRIDRYVIRHAGADGMDPAFNTRSFKIEVSTDGTSWKTVDRRSHNTDNVTDRDITPVTARYIRLSVLDTGKDKTARIGDIEIYGSRTMD
ncbi:discoidin domain-containing protein [Compostibacter hankyongensis]|uniref:F5/8 type C domain-containing protein n=1 Tax=Compostibacter hankyongensis TaxID=1007089 RepID=A0ABP8FJR6_9BACT